MIEVESKVKIPNPKKFRILAQTIGRYKGKERKIQVTRWGKDGMWY